MAGDGHGAVLSNWKSACYIRLIMLFKDLLTMKSWIMDLGSWTWRSGFNNCWKWSLVSRSKTCVSNNRGRCSNGSRGLSAHSTLEGAKNKNWTILYWRDDKKKKIFLQKINNQVWTHLKHRQHIQQLPVQVLRTMILIVMLFFIYDFNETNDLDSDDLILLMIFTWAGVETTGTAWTTDLLLSWKGHWLTKKAPKRKITKEGEHL